MSRKIIIGLVFMLLLSSINVISGNVSAEIKKEDMVWSIGDKLEFRYTTVNMNQTTIFKMTMEITGESNVDIDGINYDVFVAELTGNFETIDIASSFNLSLVQGSTINGTLYVSKENDETTKTIQDLKYQLREGTSGLGLFFNFTQTIVTITRVISTDKPDVIDVGTIWTSTIKTVTTTTTTTSGSYYDTYLQPGYSNTTTTTDDGTETFDYECVSKKNITTTAGTFETYEIRQSKIGEQGYILQYLSSAVKDVVKYTSYDNDGNIISNMELLSYNVAKTDSSSDKTKTPGFELILVFITIAIFMFWKRNKI